MLTSTFSSSSWETSRFLFMSHFKFNLCSSPNSGPKYSVHPDLDYLSVARSPSQWEINLSAACEELIRKFIQAHRKEKGRKKKCIKVDSNPDQFPKPVHICWARIMEEGTKTNEEHQNCLFLAAGMVYASFKAFLEIQCFLWWYPLPHFTIYAIELTQSLQLPPGRFVFSIFQTI